MPSLSDVSVGAGEGRKESERDDPARDLAFRDVEIGSTACGTVFEVPPNSETTQEIGDEDGQDGPVLEDDTHGLVVVLVADGDLHAAHDQRVGDHEHGHDDVGG